MVLMQFAALGHISGCCVCLDLALLRTELCVSGMKVPSGRCAPSSAHPTYTPDSLHPLHPYSLHFASLVSSMGHIGWALQASCSGLQVSVWITPFCSEYRPLETFISELVLFHLLVSSTEHFLLHSPRDFWVSEHSVPPRSSALSS